MPPRRRHIFLESALLDVAKARAALLGISMTSYVEQAVRTANALDPEVQAAIQRAAAAREMSNADFVASAISRAIRHLGG